MHRLQQIAVPACTQVHCSLFDTLIGRIVSVYSLGYLLITSLAVIIGFAICNEMDGDDFVVSIQFLIL